MAELNTGDGGGKKGGGKVRSKKSNAKVDLTAMVDLAFLLITFFMLTTSLSKPQSMDLGLPDKDEKERMILSGIAKIRLCAPYISGCWQVMCRRTASKQGAPATRLLPAADCSASIQTASFIICYIAVY